jgi:hypothetical protein
MLRHRRIALALLLASLACSTDREQSFTPQSDAAIREAFTGEWASGDASTHITLCPREGAAFCANDVCAAHQNKTPCHDISPRSPPETLTWTESDAGCDAYGCEAYPLRSGFAATLTLDAPGCHIERPVHVADGPPDGSMYIEDVPAPGEIDSARYVSGPVRFFVMSPDAIALPGGPDAAGAAGGDGGPCDNARDDVERLLLRLGGVTLKKSRQASAVCSP